MKVLQINSAYKYGSTGRIVAHLKQAIEAEGGECLVAYGRDGSLEQNVYKIGTKFDVYFHALMTRITDRTAFYSKKYTKKLIKKIVEFQPEVIHLHNLHGYYINIEILFDFLKQYGRPVIWTLHDCWAFTGHCSHFTIVQCEQWKIHCRKCEQKKQYPASYVKDNCRLNFEKKRAAFYGVKNMTIVTPSKWLADLVRQSFLKEYPVKVIYNGIDVDQFKPLPGDFRKTYKIEDKFLILGVANVWNKHKGFEDFLKLSNMLDENSCIVMVGVSEKQLSILPSNIIGIRKTKNVNQLAQIYSSADLFLNLTYEDNYPTVNLESMACGTPVLTYKTGGSPESITAESGFIVDQGDLEGVLECVQKVKQANPQYFQSCMSRKDLFDNKNSNQEYLDLYKSALYA